MTALALAAALFSMPMAVAADAAPGPAVPSPDTTDVAAVRVRPAIPLGALYSGTFGVGLGAGARVDHLLGAGSDVTATAFGALYGYGAALTVRTGDPFAEPVYGLLHPEASRATRRRFYGAGPFTDEADRLDLDHTSASVEARGGVYPLGTTALLVQPSVRLLVDRLDAIEPDTEAALQRLDAASQASVRALDADTRLGVSFGLALASDRLDRHAYPSAGTFASLEGRRFQALDGSGLGFTRVEGAASGYLPVRPRTAVYAQAAGVVTRPDAGDALPFVYLPTLDNTLLLAYATDRFRGRDAAVLTVGARAPVADLFGLYGLDLDVSGTVGSVYDDISDQFTTRIAFEASPDPGAAAPLRPVASVALRLVRPASESVVIGGRIGIGPEGIAAALVSIAADPRDLLPLFR